MGLGISQRHQHLGVLKTELSFPSLSNFPGHTTQLPFPYLGEMMRNTVSSSWDVSWWGALLLKNSGPQERPLPPAQVTLMEHRRGAGIQVTLIQHKQGVGIQVTLIQHRRGAGIQVLQIVQPPSGLKEQVTGCVQSPEKLIPYRLALLCLTRSLNTKPYVVMYMPFQSRNWVRTT